MDIKIFLKLVELLQQKNPPFKELIELLFSETPPPDGNYIARAPLSCIAETIKNTAPAGNIRMPVFSVVIPSFNGAERSLGETISSLLSQTGVNADDYEIIIVDDGTKAGVAKAVVREFIDKNPGRNITYTWYPENRGPAFARNIGAQIARGEYLCFTDDDCIVPPDWLLNFKSAFGENPEITAVGGWYIPIAKNPGGRVSVYDSFIFWVTVPEILQKVRANSLWGVRGMAGNTANFCVRKNVLAAVGGFNHYFRFASMEDWELRTRLLERGYMLLYLPTMVLHKKDLTLKSFVRRKFIQGWGAYIIYCLHPALAAQYRRTLFNSITASFSQVPWILAKRHIVLPFENPPAYSMLFLPLHFFRRLLLWFGKYSIAFELLSRNSYTKKDRALKQ